MPPDKSEPGQKSLTARSDGRRTLLIYMDAQLIKDVKKAALDEERTVYEIVEEATRDWMGRRVSSHTKKINKSIESKRG